jgi:hypothetical protein
MGCNNDITSFIIFIAFILLIVWIWTIMRNRSRQKQYARAMARANADGIEMAQLVPKRDVTGQGEGIMDF